MSTAVADSSPIIVFSRLNYLKLLGEVFERVYIPRRVFKEVTSKKDAVSMLFREFLGKGFFEKHDISNRTLVEYLNKELGLGESEAIVLALELKSDFVILDDHVARNIAHRVFGLNVMGTVGVLRVFWSRGLVVDDLEVLYGKLVKEHFWIAKPLFVKIMQG